jgi:hypothetical protein
VTPTSVSTHLTPHLHRCLDGHAAVDVATWRLCWLLEAGFDPALAEALARTPAVDLHALLELVDRGCPPAIAARILSPLPQPTQR